MFEVSHAWHAAGDRRLAEGPQLAPIVPAREPRSRLAPCSEATQPQSLGGASRCGLRAAGWKRGGAQPPLRPARSCRGLCLRLQNRSALLLIAQACTRRFIPAALGSEKGVASVMFKNIRHFMPSVGIWCGFFSYYEKSRMEMEKLKHLNIFMFNKV